MLKFVHKSFIPLPSESSFPEMQVNARSILTVAAHCSFEKHQNSMEHKVRGVTSAQLKE